MSDDALAKKYEENLVAFERAMAKVVSDLSALITDYASDYKIRYKKNFEKRVKTFESVKEKLKRKCVTDLFELNDLVGVKLIVNNLKDAQKLAELVSEKWKEKEVEVENYISSPKSTGYRAIHINLVQAVDVKGNQISVPVEIQIKTLAQDLWSVLTHGDLYKPDGEVPEIISQFSSSLGALLDVVDNQAQFIRDFLVKKIIISKQLTFDPKDEVDKEIIAKIIFDTFGSYITEEDFGYIIKNLEIYNITTVDIFKKLVHCSEVMDAVKQVFDEFKLGEPEPADLISYGSIAFYNFLSEDEVDLDLIRDTVKEVLDFTENECESCGKLLTQEEVSYCCDHVENCDYVCKECLESYNECMRCGNKTDNDHDVCDNCWDNMMEKD